MKCKIKSAKPTQDPCFAISPSKYHLLCTRKRGHKGKHHAHGTNSCFETWNNYGNIKEHECTHTFTEWVIKKPLWRSRTCIKCGYKQEEMR